MQSSPPPEIRYESPPADPLSHKGLAGVGFGFRGGKPPLRRRAAAATVRAAAARAATSCLWSEDGSASTSQGEIRSRDGFAPAPLSGAPAARSDSVSALGVLHPAAEGERKRCRHRQHEPVALHPRGVSPPFSPSSERGYDGAPPARGQFAEFPPLPAHAFQRLESRFYPEPHLAPRRPGLLRFEVGQDDPRLVLTLDLDDDYRPPKPSGRRSERRSFPDEGAARIRNRVCARAYASLRRCGTSYL